MSIQALYISYDGMSDPLGQSQVLPYLAGLFKKGVSFSLISFEKKDRYNSLRLDIDNFCKTHGVEWYPLIYTKNPPVLSTLWDYYRMRKKADEIRIKKAIQVVHCRSYIPALVGLRMKRKFQTKFIFDTRSFWVDERVDGGLWNLKNPLYNAMFRFFKAKERDFLNEANKVIAVTKAGKSEMLHWGLTQLAPKNIVVIPGAADFHLFKPITAESRVHAKKSLGVAPSSFILSYVGSIGTWYLLDEMMRFFKLLKERLPFSKFLFLTPAPPEQILSCGAAHGIEPDDIIVNFAPRKTLPDLAHASDMNIFFIRPSYSKISSSPVKMGEILAMGIPIICNNGVGDVEQIVRDTNSGFCLHDFSSTTMRNIIDKISSGITFNSNEIRGKAEATFGLDNALEAYSKVYQELF